MRFLEDETAVDAFDYGYADGQKELAEWIRGILIGPGSPQDKVRLIKEVLDGIPGMSLATQE